VTASDSPPGAQTARFVHVGCLAAWRTVSTGSASFHACEVCGHRYNTRVTSWAWLLESRLVLLGVTFAMLLSLVAQFGKLCCALDLDLPHRFYMLCRWTPPWLDASGARFGAHLHRHAQSCDTAVAGAVIVGSIGAVRCAWKSYLQDSQFFWHQALPSLVVTCASSGTSALRLFVVGGLLFGGRDAGTDLHALARSILIRFGERVLDIGE